jgi:hypothetical protein
MLSNPNPATLHYCNLAAVFRAFRATGRQKFRDQYTHTRQLQVE